MQILKEIKQNPNYTIDRIKINENNNAVRLIHKNKGFVHTFDDNDEYIVCHYETCLMICKITSINMFANRYTYSHYNNEGEKFYSSTNEIIKEDLLELSKEEQLKECSKHLKSRGFKMADNKNIVKAHLNKSLEYLRKNKSSAVEIQFDYTDLGLVVRDYYKYDKSSDNVEYRLFEYNGNTFEPLNKKDFDQLIATLEHKRDRER